MVRYSVTGRRGRGQKMQVTVKPKPFSDFEALQNITQDASTDVVQIGRGRMSGELTHVSLDKSFGISRGSFSTGIRLSGVPSQERWLLGMLLATDGPASSQQRDMTPGNLLMVAPGQERYSSYQGSATFGMALVGDEELQRFLDPQPGAYEALIKLPPVSVLAGNRLAAAGQIERMTTLTTLLAEHGPTLPDQSVDFYRRNLLELVTAPIRERANYHGARLHSADRLVREVDRYMIEAGNRPVSISELVAHFNVPRRTLHRTFVDVLGMPPISFLRRKRLGDVHTALLMTDDPEIKIRELAREHGFIELGRFAAAYRRTYGELPSATLRRRRFST